MRPRAPRRPPLLLAAAGLCGRGGAEQPPGAVPSQGSVSFFADYELVLDPEAFGAPPLHWRLAAWRFQHDLAAFYEWRERCGAGALCPAPPLGRALLVLSLPAAARAQLLRECRGMVLASLLLAAEARLTVAPAEARRLFAEAERLRLEAPAPGWGLDAAARWFLAANGSAAPSRPPDAVVVAPPAGPCAAAGVDVVVAHCREDLGWLASLAGVRIWVYEKCGGTEVPRLACLSVVQLPNMAMESLAYATHMRDQYGAFAPFTLFLQGSPREHALRPLLEDVLQSLGAGAYGTPFLHLNGRRFLAGASFCHRDLFQRLFQSAAAPEVLGSYCCSQFVVRRDRLLARPRELYARIVQILMGELPLACAQDDGFDARPGIAVSALFEHLWHAVLGEAAVLPPRHADGRLPLFARLDEAPGALPADHALPWGAA